MSKLVKYFLGLAVIAALTGCDAESLKSSPSLNSPSKICLDNVT